MTDRDGEISGPKPAAVSGPTLVERRPQLKTSLIAAVVWVLLWGDLSLANLLSGFVLGLLITWVFPLPPIPYAGRLRPWSHTVLIAHLLWDLTRSSFVVAAQAFKFGHTMTNAVVRVDLRSRSDLYLTLTSELTCLVPGSLVMEARRQESVIYLHVMDVRSRADVPEIRRTVLAAEARVIRAFGSDAEVARLKAGWQPESGLPGETDPVSRGRQRDSDVEKEDGA